MKQAERNASLLNEKKEQLDTQLATAQRDEEAQTKKLQDDLQTAVSELTQTKKECENIELQLSDLQAKNDLVQSEGWERKLMALQDEF